MKQNQSTLYQDRFEHDACGIGAVVSIDGIQEHKVLDDALTIVEKLEHRAGKDATGQVGDGVGILTQISHSFFKKAASSLGISLGKAGDYGVGMFFFPQDTLKRNFSRKMFEVILQKKQPAFTWLEKGSCPSGNPGRLCKRENALYHTVFY